MSKPLWAIWDSFGGADDRAYARERITRPTHFNEFRCRDRARDVVLFSAGAPDAPSAGALASDLQRRQSHWLDELESGRAEIKPFAIRPKWVRNVVFVGCLALPFLVAAIAISQIDRGPWLIAVFMVAPISSVAFWPLFKEMERTARQFTARFRARQCPDCGHDLSTVPPAIDSETLHGQWVGPVECPGCGVPWPMVPPPVPVSQPEG